MSDDAPDARVVLVTAEAALRSAVATLGRARRIALDIESNGLFKYKAGLCTLQLLDPDAPDAPTFVVDALSPTSARGRALTAPLADLGPLLGEDGPTKIVHDVAFDARILAESGLRLARVLDTSLAARMLGRTSTGLASLLASELDVRLDKKLQHHDWTERPLRAAELRYLGEDVRYLGLLADRIGAELAERGIAEELECETRYRLAQAEASAKSIDPRPPYLRLKGVDRIASRELPILRRIAQIREDKARELDVPPYKVLGPDVLFAIAAAQPTNMTELEKVRGATNGHRARSLARAMLEGVAAGVSDGDIPEEEQAMLVRPRPPGAVVRARRARESRLTSWRKAEAKRRGVDEQVVLPGHCLQELAELEDASLDAIAAIPGIGAFRVARDGPSLLTAIQGGAREA